ncbi:MAG: cupin domain-containing protein [Bacteroidales bacterium]|nr:cupin domain-containing protein [Bacteroidales bacterium]
MDNIFSPPPPRVIGDEFFETLCETDGLRIERIVGVEPINQPGEWFDQEDDEWVVLLSGEAELEIKDEKILVMKAGDSIFLPAHKIHRVNRTSASPQCIWLAVFGKMK